MAAKLYGADNAPLKIQFITDPHYYSRKAPRQGLRKSRGQEPKGH